MEYSQRQGLLMKSVNRSYESHWARHRLNTAVWRARPLQRQSGSISVQYVEISKSLSCQRTVYRTVSSGSTESLLAASARIASAPGDAQLKVLLPEHSLEKKTLFLTRLEFNSALKPLLHDRRSNRDLRPAHRQGFRSSSRLIN